MLRESLINFQKPVKLNKLVKLNFLSALIIALIAISCEPNNSQSNEKSDNEFQFSKAELIPIDSIKIDLQRELSFYDYYEPSGLFLAGDVADAFTAWMPPGGPKAINQIGHQIINREGQIISSFNNANDGPEGFGRGALSSFFIDEKRLGVLSLKGLYIYDFAGNLLDKIANLNYLNVIGFSTHKVAAFNLRDSVLAIALPKLDSTSFGNIDKAFENSTALSFIDVNKLGQDFNDVENLGREFIDVEMATISSYGFPEYFVYNSNFRFIKVQKPPMLAHNRSENELLVLYPEVPKLYSYDMLDGSFLDSIDLNPSYFKTQEELKVPDEEYVDWWNGGGMMANSYFRQIIQLKNYTLIRYTTAIPENKIKEMIPEGGIRQSPNWPIIRKSEFKNIYQIYLDGKKLVKDFEIPLLELKEIHKDFFSSKEMHGQILGGNGLDEIFIYQPNDGEVERDYELIIVYKLELR
ncbi:hypothetical protein ACOXY6_12125 [Cytophagales bacterium EPR-FJ-38]